MRTVTQAKVRKMCKCGASNKHVASQHVEIDVDPKLQYPSILSLHFNTTWCIKQAFGIATCGDRCRSKATISIHSFVASQHHPQRNHERTHGCNHFHVTRIFSCRLTFHRSTSTPKAIGQRTRRDVNSLSSKYKKITTDIAVEDRSDRAEMPV